MGKLIVKVIIAILLLMGVWSEYANTKVFASSEWTKSTKDLHTKITRLGVDNKLGESIISECKKTAKNPLKCVKTTVSIYGNESGFGKRCKNNSCFGVISKSFPNKKLAMKDFVKRYNRLWYTHNGGGFFYGGRGWLGRSEFCHDEASSGSKLGCPNGAKTFNYFYNKL